MNLNEICKELDSLSLRMLQLMKEYINVKLTIEALIKNGCLHLAKSRYIMGNRNVSALQLPSEESNDINALAKVVSRETNDSEDILSLELNRLSLHDIGKSNDSEILRQRSKNKKDDSIAEDTTKILPSVQDPLKWFGVLVPQDMRHAQSNFNNAIECIIQCVNIQLEMLSVEEKYKKFLNKKEEFSKQ